MKKLFIIFGLCFSIGIIGFVPMLLKKYNLVFQQDTEWVSVDNGIWVGKEEILYKIGGENILLFTKDGGKKWDFVTDGVWQGKTEKWYKFENGKLFVSENIAMDWVKSLDNKWEGSDGNW